MLDPLTADPDAFAEALVLTVLDSEVVVDATSVPPVGESGTP